MSTITMDAAPGEAIAPVIDSPTPQPLPRSAPIALELDLEWTAEALAGGYSPVRSWAHLGSLVARVGRPTWGWVVVHRRDDPAQRFAQCSGSGEALLVELGALDAASGRHTVWRLRRGAQPAELGELMGAEEFVAVARDWLTIGVAPGYAATTIPFEGAGEEPF